MKSQEKRNRGDAENAEGSQRGQNGLAFAVHDRRISRSKLHGAEKRKERSACVNVFEALAGLQGGSAAGEDDVFGERRAVFDADAEVFADGVVDRRLEKEEFERLSAFETQKVEIRKAPQLGSDIEVGAGVGQEDAGVDEIGLTFFLAGAKRRNEAAGRGEKNAGAKKANGFAIPEAEEAAGKIREIDDRVKAAGTAISRMGVAGSVEGGDAVADPILIVGDLSGGHLRVDGDAASGDGIESVLTDGLIEGVREIEAVDVSAAEPAEITDANAVEDGACARILVDDIADGRGANKEAVVVIVKAGIVFVPGSDEFRGVAGKKEVLEIDVAEKDLLVAPVERVESAVGVFFEKMEIGNVVFDAITVEVAEDTQGRLFVDKKKAAEVGVELLDAGARGDEIVVGTEVMELHFDEGFLQAEMIVEAVGAAARVRADEAELADLQIVEAELRSDANTPVDGLEGRVAVK